METITEFNIYKFELPLISPVKIKNNIIVSRFGAIINIKTSSGFSSFGETAPLPFFHKEVLTETVLQLREIKKAVLKTRIRKTPYHDKTSKKKFLDFNALPEDNQDLLNLAVNFNNYFSDNFFFFNDIFSNKNIFTSVRFGVEMALLNLFFSTPEFKTSLLKTGNDCLLVCKLLMDLNTDLGNNLHEIIRNKYRTVKIKVARQPLETEINKIKAVKKFIKNNSSHEVKIRLDANGLWSLKEAIYFGKQVGSDGIEYIEDPLNNINQYPTFFTETGIPAALDEKLNDFLAMHDISKINNTGFDYLKAFILKPDFIGGFSKTSELIALTKKKGINCVLSNSFGSNLAISSIALFAYMMNLQAIPAGLDTMRFFKTNLLKEDIKISDGSIKLAQVQKNISNINFNLLESLNL